MKTTKQFLGVALLGASALAFAPSCFGAVTATALTSFDPTTHFAGATAGFDFDDGSPTQAGFTGIPASQLLAYSVANGGINLNIAITGATSGQNQNRDRGATSGGGSAFVNGDLTRDFEQWFNNSGTSVLVEGSFAFTNLMANTDYEITFFAYNIGANQNPVKFYEGTSSADPLITTFTPSGGPADRATWSPGVTFAFNSGATGVFDITAQSDAGSRLTINGLSIVQVPEPSAALLGALGALLLLRRRR